jgi:hypothetical protein
MVVCGSFYVRYHPGVLSPPSGLLFALAIALSFARLTLAQEGASAGEKRVKISQNNDGSRTTYEIDMETHKAVATTFGADGKVESTIRYDLDDAGRYARGEIFGRDGQLRLKSVYRYDAAGRLEQETQLTKDDVVKNKLVYSYDQLTGRQTGYAVYDATGKLVTQTNTNAGAAASGKNAPVKSGR